MPESERANISSVCGLVLAGGRSSRMGQDKGQLYYHTKPQQEHVFDMLSLHCTSVCVSCNKEQSASLTHLPIIEDSYEDAGPIGGILSAFQYNPAVAWLVVACDMPFLKETTLAYLLQKRDKAKMATAFWNAEGDFPEPLVTIWEPQAFKILLDAYAKGYRSPGRILAQNDTALLAAPDASEFRNVNTPAEYNTALDFLKQ